MHELTEDQVAALVAAGQLWGRQWRSHLRLFWCSDRRAPATLETHEAALRQLRNASANKLLEYDMRVLRRLHALNLLLKTAPKDHPALSYIE